MPVCAIVTAVNEVIQSFRDLQERVSILIYGLELPENLSSLCGDGTGLINEMYNSVVSFVLAAGSEVSETVPSPITPAEQVCHTWAYLYAVKTWIDGIIVDGENICSLNLNSAGGDEGYDETFGASNGGYTLILTYETFWQKDRIILYNQSDDILFDSGCVGTGGEKVANIPVPIGTTEIRVVVEPNCEGGTGTAWYLRVECE